ncbi:sulfate/molybdate ABC transporter ATP-binding protein [Bacillus sp. PS06]|uniref:sulfate/molybdate ABC transporter ATP-binding protein n=1 Tax=Bacillus sp. PS06 TaxID=2764176 RepID=UPI00177ADABC|nr:sulfate ABC transporter ATP-binding protein [Bacillus sp. PS06]MBD8067644.1 sulfate ABC transporter ATP-binding protein [Bacillus sp. PS06]
MSITIKNVSKSFGSFAAVDQINLDIPTGEFVALLGPSGSGKTTLLRMIAGLEQVDHGKIFFKEMDSTNKSVKDRKVGFVFQHYALFKHMNIFENIAFGLRVRPRKIRPSNGQIEAKVRELLSFVQLEELADRYPSQLSGGQRQRIALARALAVEPEVLLLDEPFGALDAKVRQELRHWLREVHERLNITTVFVTHDQEEALEMADTVVVMNKGRVEQIGSPEEIYQHPVNAFVYSFLGRVNTFKGDENNQVESYIRPHEISVSKNQLKHDEVKSEVYHVYTIGAIMRIELKRLDTGEFFEVELNDEKYKEIGPLEKGDILFVDLLKMKRYNDRSRNNLFIAHS